MLEKQVSTNYVIAAAAWIVTVALYAAAGGLMVSGQWRLAIFIAEVACGSAAYAAVRHLRCYHAHLSSRLNDIALDRDIARLSTR